MRFMYKCRGSVSIFLALVLLPMLTVASIFVDLSRVRMGKAVVETSADMALNAAISQYDNMVKDIYGLFTTSQDIDEIYDKLEQYYKKAIMEQGIDESDAAYISSNIMGVFFTQSSETDNLLQIESKSFKLEPVANTSLINPVFMKSQIVEFMKYRAPIKGGLSLLEGLKIFNQIQDQMEVIDKKNSYYKAKEELVDDFGAVWNELREYQYRNKSNPPAESDFPWSDDYIKNEINAFRNYKADIESAYNTVLYYYQIKAAYSNTLSDGYVLKDAFKINDNNDGNYTGVTVNNGKTIYIDTVEDGKENIKVGGDEVVIWKRETETGPYIKIKDYSDSYSITDTNAGGTIDGLWADYDECAKKISELAVYKDILNKETYKNGQNANVYLLRNFFEDSITYKGYIDTMDSIKKKAQNLKNELDNGRWGNDKVRQLIQSKYDTIDDLTGKCSGYIDNYNSTIDNLSEFLDGFRANYKTDIANLQSTLSAIGTRFAAMNDILDTKINNLENAKTYLGAAKEHSKDCDTKRNEWSGKTEKLSEDDQTKVSNSTEIEREKKVISTEEIEAMLTRVDNAQKTLKAIKALLEKYKYLGDYSWEILSSGSADDFYDKLRSAIQNYGIVSNENTLWDEYEKIEAASISDYATITTYLNSANYGVVISEAYNGVIDNEFAIDLTVNQRQLYSWMYENFGGDIFPEEGGADTSKEQTKKAAKEKKEEQKNKFNDDKIKGGKDSQVARTDMGDLSKYFTEDEKKKLPTTKLKEMRTELQELEQSTQAKSLNVDDSNDEDKLLEKTSGSDGNGGLLAFFGDLVKDISYTMRDEIYIATYIMNTFSYKTYEAELIDKYNNKNTTELPVKAIYNTDYTIDTEYANVVSEAKSLTNFPINPNNNCMYGSEIEYMIYGDPNKDIFGTIFAIRFACNTVYAFMDPQVNSYTTSLATAIFGTPPLTPLIPAAKIAFTLAWSLAESGIDIYRLKQGEAVPLMKNSATWVLSPENLAKGLADRVENRVKQGVGKLIQDGADKLNEWTQMADEELDKKIAEYKKAIQDGTGKAETDIGKYIDAMGQSYIDQMNAYAHQAVNEYISICNSVKQRVCAIPSTVYTDEEKARLSDDDRYFYELFADGNVTEEKTAQLIDYEMRQWLEKEGNTNGFNNAIYEAKKIAVDKLIGDISTISKDYKMITSTKFEGEIDDITATMSKRLSDKISTIKTSVEDAIKKGLDGTENCLMEGKKQIVDKVNECVDGGAAKLKEYAANGIDKAFEGISNVFSNGTLAGATGKGSNPAQTLMSNLLSWRYSDYLNVFLLVNLFADDSKVLSRMADVMQINIVNMPDGNKDFLFSETYTYMSLTTEAEVKPLLSIGFLRNIGIENESSDWYKIKYTNILGY